MTARLPRPGQPVRGSSTGRPLMAAMDLLGRRWALRILWELRDQPLGARALRSRCDGMSSSVLYQRLEELTAAGLLTRDDADRYQLTELGAALRPALGSLDAWASRWAAALQQAAQPARAADRAGSHPPTG
jgi:DNA-binding HxlR family transcriptional regulator